MKRPGNQAQADELGKDPAQVGPRSAGQSGGSQRLSPIADAAEGSPEGSEDAADHRERPAHTHEEYGRPDDVPPKAARQS